MTTSTQENRLLRFTSPLGENFLLIQRMVAREEMSQLFSVDVELVHDENEAGYTPTDIDVTAILGKMVTIAITQRDGTERTLNGMVNSFSKGHRKTRFSHYSAHIVPEIWLLTQNFQSRIFQHKSVPDILEEVFQGFLVSFEIQGDFKARNYCVQYRETDFDFASRLMQEEGLFYYFEHSGESHKLIVANSPQSHQDTPSKNVIPFYVQTNREEDFVSTIRDFWVDTKLQTGTVTLWDNSFQLPGNKLDAQQPSLFTVGDNKNLEYYDFPAGYARKYDGIDGTGGEREDLQNVYPDKSRTAENMMNALDSGFKVHSGISDCSAMTAGYRFTLEDHPAEQLNAQYVITSVTHQTEQNPQYVTEDIVEQPYSNSFTCIPHGSGAPKFCPPRTIAKPLVHGAQTATVVGPGGEEIFTDKYGRVKVQFHWDRDGQVDANSSCWIRVAQGWAGNRWGMMFIPRIGMEVLVNFIDGDPDEPIISGCVYNPQTMPPYVLPDEKTKMAIKSDSSKGGDGFNEIRFEDKKGEEQVFIHGEKDMDIRVKNDRRELIGNDRHLIVNRDKRDRIKRDEHRIIERDLIEQIERDYHLTIMGKVAVAVQENYSNDLRGNLDESIGGNHSEEVSGNYSLSATNIVLEGTTGITLKVGGNFITINSGGIFIQGSMVMINSGGAALPGMGPSLVPPLEPEEAHVADNADPGSKAPTYKNQKRKVPPAKKPSFTKPTNKPKNPKNKEKKAWIEIELKDQDGVPAAGVRYRVTLPDGETLSEGTLDSEGFAKVSNIDPGSCKVTFPELDKTSWKKKG